MAQARRSEMIRFRGTKLDAKRLRALARASELTPSETLRRLISDACKVRGLEVKA